ncbi:hypothetical protein COU18_00975 [Candidatus Kaiserbacteria bacterium CG10_big_fil_rev_8_21_14_0_10_51_14]|uniref:Septum formation initiator n=1 Tax=Candidatus Kaiserbacteria bacterium CG10_big_fil_rev_8_21_14_0_10_51_14 TaxID=1974610 RepID=A0A2H0UC16_9BACT|nr:MAG: hypothetical protein COU18_00975 [Candidatus Kaiserbacteria bacterium CG10_big_fil_rev_8_21_14_0_10_51_14]
MAIRRRNNPVRLLGKRLLVVALLALTIAISWGTWNAYKKERESGVLRTEAELQLEDFTQRHTQLTEDIASLQTSRGMEEVLREQYALAARGEGLIVIVDQPAAEPESATTTTMFEKVKRFFWRW